jgi:dolichol-phosphate mannosyltransferase
MLISVVVPILNEQDNLAELHRRIVAQLDLLGDAWEIIIVDDGSSDESPRLLARMHAEDVRIRIVTLSRNFGHQQAISAGLHHARGDGVVVLDGDLQDPPEIIPALVDRWKAGFQVVVGERRSRSDRGARGVGFRLFYPVFRWLADVPLTHDAGVFCLMDRVVVDALEQVPERNRFLPGLRSWIGYRQTTVVYDRGPRAAGHPKQSWTHLVHYAIDATVGFSRKPLRLATWLGFGAVAVALVLGGYCIVAGAMRGTRVGIAETTIACATLLGGVQLVCLGILGEYLGRIHDEVRGRPLYVVERRLGFDGTETAAIRR